MPQRLVTDEGDLFCSGGPHAGVDRALYLVRRICGPEKAAEAARLLLHDPARQAQSPYTLLDFQKAHGDEAVLATQQHLEQTHDHPKPRPTWPAA
jgi:transcriptional regulator GlxA family with amidase domain